MKRYKLIGVILIGVVIVYIFMETLDAVDPKQYHIELGTYSTTPNLSLTTVSGTASVYPGTLNLVQRI